MAEFLQFLGEQWHLSGTLVALVFLFVWNENRRAGAVVSVHQLTQLVNAHNAQVVDLREAKEFREGHITGAINIPFAKLDEQVGILDQAHPIVLVDKIGQHSPAAGRKLKQAGFTVVRLRGGMSDWQAASLPLVKGSK